MLFPRSSAQAPFESILRGRDEIVVPYISLKALSMNKQKEFLVTYAVATSLKTAVLPAEREGALGNLAWVASSVAQSSYMIELKNLLPVIIWCQVSSESHSHVKKKLEACS